MSIAKPINYENTNVRNRTLPAMMGQLLERVTPGWRRMGPLPRERRQIRKERAASRGRLFWRSLQPAVYDALKTEFQSKLKLSRIERGGGTPEIVGARTLSDGIHILEKRGCAGLVKFV